MSADNDTEVYAFEAWWNAERTRTWQASGADGDRGPIPGSEWSSSFVRYARAAWMARAALAAPAAPPAAQDADLWCYIAQHWTYADFRWNRDAGNTPQSVVLTIKTGPGADKSDGGQLRRFLTEAIAAAPSAAQEAPKP